MVLNYLSTDTLEEVPTIKNYKKLTWYLLVLQFGVSVLYHFGRTSGSGIYYGWTKVHYDDAKDECNYLEYDSTNVNWTEYQCDDYFKIFYSDSDYDRYSEHFYYRYYFSDGSYDFVEDSDYKKYNHNPWKCKNIRNRNDDVYTSYSNWINDGCEDRFSSPEVDYYCAWEIYECDDYFSHIVTKFDYWEEDDCKDKNKGDDYICDWYFDNFDSPNYICTNHNSSTHKNWTHACNCKDYAGDFYHKVEKSKCTDYSNTATYTCNNNNTNHSIYDNACSCKDYVLDAYEWYVYDCNKEYNNENWLPSHAGISFPWVGGMWFVLAIWTTTLPQEFKDCFLYTLISLVINIAADTVNSFYDDGITIGTLVGDDVSYVYFDLKIHGITTWTLGGFSFIIVFPCLTLMKKAFQKSELSTKEKEAINVRTIALNKIRTIFLIGLAQVYISLPAYQHTFEQSIGEEFGTNSADETDGRESFLEFETSLLRLLIPTATGGIFNVAYVVSILFVDITRLHFVDCLEGNAYNLEFLIGLLQVIGFALVLGLNALELPTKEKVVLELSDPTEETDIPYVISKKYSDSAVLQFYMINNIYWSTLGCILFIWIFISFLAAHVKNDGSYMKYFENRWLKREAAKKMGITKELIKNHSIINKDELIQLKKFITNELEKLLIEINNLFSDGINKKLFNDLLKTLHNEIYTTINDTILPIQSIQIFGILTSKHDLMEQWCNLSSHKVKKPLKKLKSKINEHLTNEKNTSDNRRKLLAENFTIQSQQEIPSTTDNWTRLFCEAENIVEQKMKIIEDKTNDKMDDIKRNVQIASKNLRAMILKNNTNSIEVSKEFEDALVELEIYTHQEVNKMLTYISKQYSDGPYKNTYYNLLHHIKTKFNIIATGSSDKSMIEFVDLSFDTNYDEQFDVLINKTFKNPLTTLENDIIDHIIDYINEQTESNGTQQLENLLLLSNDVTEKIDNVVAAIDNKAIEIKSQFNITLQQDEEGQTADKTTTVDSQENEQLQDEICERKVNDNMGNLRTSNKMLEQHIRDGAQVNKLKLKKMRLQQDNERQTVNETKAFFNKKLEEQINQLIQVNMRLQEDNELFQEDNIQLKKDIKEIQADNIQLNKDNNELKEKLDGELKNIYNILEKHSLKF